MQKNEKQINFLISAYTGLGNFILKTPMIKKIKELYPNSKIDIICGNKFGVEFVLKKGNLIDNIIVIDEKKNLIKQIFSLLKLKKKYDVFFLPFDAQPVFLDLFSFLFAKEKYKHFYVPKNFKNKIKLLLRVFLGKAHLVPVLGGRHEIDLNYDLLEYYINKPFSFEREYKTIVDFEKNDEVLKKFNLKKNCYIVLQIGAANGLKSAKKWKRENFEKLIYKLNSSLKNYKVVLVGDKGDYENDIKPLEKNKNIEFVNTAGLTTINEVANILYYSKVVVAHDSGIMHLANALNCNLIALFGPTDCSRTKPIGKNVSILYSYTDCFAKMYNFNTTEFDLLNKYTNCMDGILVEDVYNEILKKVDC